MEGKNEWSMKRDGVNNSPDWLKTVDDDGVKNIRRHHLTITIPQQPDHTSLVSPRQPSWDCFGLFRSRNAISPTDLNIKLSHEEKINKRNQIEKNERLIKQAEGFLRDSNSLLPLERKAAEDKIHTLKSATNLMKDLVVRNASSPFSLMDEDMIVSKQSVRIGRVNVMKKKLINYFKKK